MAALTVELTPHILENGGGVEPLTPWLKRPLAVHTAFRRTVHILVNWGNFEIPTRRVKTSCSASELPVHVLVVPDGFEPST